MSQPERIPIARRIELRTAIGEALFYGRTASHGRPRGVLVEASELALLLDSYEHGGFQTAAPRGFEEAMRNALRERWREAKADWRSRNGREKESPEAKERRLASRRKAS